MNMKFVIKQGGGVPAGLYKAKFLAVESTKHEEFGAGLKFIFEVVEGDHAGEKTTRITSSSPTLKNAAGRIIAGIIGETLTAETTVDLDLFVGREYLAQVESLASGQGTRIASVMPAWNK